jgi:hypothetical protein
MSYVDELARELGAVGIGGGRRERILAEVGDHLRSDPEAESRFGPSRELANAFAADAGTTESRRAAVIAFGALAVAGIVYAIAFVAFGRASHLSDPPLASLAFFVIVLAPQIAFVAGALALLRAWRGRARGVLSSAERTVLARRTNLALGAGLATMAAVLVYAIEIRSSISGWLFAFTLAGAGAASMLLVVAIVPSVRAARLRPRIAGPAGDVFDDLGLAGYRARPWRFALIVAGLAGLGVWFAGIAGADPIDGFIRGVFEALACLGGFALLGRYLSLRG